MHRGDVVEVVLDSRPEPWLGEVRDVQGQVAYIEGRFASDAVPEESDRRGAILEIRKARERGGFR